MWSIQELTIFVFATLVEVLNCQKYDDDKITCTDKEIQTAGCIHGQCFIIIINGYREAACHCYPDYAGFRCQELNIELIFATTNIYIIVGVIILSLILAFIIFVICYRRIKGQPLSDLFKTSDPRLNYDLKSEEADVFELQTLNGDRKIDIPTIEINGRPDNRQRDS